MKRLTETLVKLVLVLGAVGQIQAGTIAIDFEEFSDTENLHGVNLGGVTLSNPSGAVEIHDNRFGVSYHSATKSVASPCGLVSVNPLIGIFDSPVSVVSLWGGDAGTFPETDSWELLAFDAPVGGNLVGAASSGRWRGRPYRQLTVAAENIWRFEANWTGSRFGIGYDDLEFQVIPEPATLVLLTIGSGGLLLWWLRGWRVFQLANPDACKKRKTFCTRSANRSIANRSVTAAWPCENECSRAGRCYWLGRLSVPEKGEA